MSDQPTSIHDAIMQPIGVSTSATATRWSCLTFDDHLLRRFGLAEVHLLRPSQEPPRLRLRQQADEVWVLLEGRCEFVWRDLRPASPTFEKVHREVREEPTRVLAPFGVAFGVRALEGQARLMRLATHADGEHSGDRELPWIQA